MTNGPTNIPTPKVIAVNKIAALRRSAYGFDVCQSSVKICLVFLDFFELFFVKINFLSILG